jgi:hypothetical protein
VEAGELMRDEMPERIAERIDDERLDELCRSLVAAEPSAGFANRTMKAVKRAPLPAGRVPLRHPLGSAAAWAALIAGGVILAWALVVPQLGTGVMRLVGHGIGFSGWLAQLFAASVSVLDVLVAPSTAVTRAVVTREGVAGLAFISAIGLFSASALHKLLSAENSERGASRWQEL